MVSSIRQQFNQAFTQERYQEMLRGIDAEYDYKIPFRIAETPVFVSKDLKKQLFEACELISDVLCAPDFKEKSKSALLAGQEVPNETDHTLFLQMDFGICQNPDGSLSPQLIEVQGFPSLYFFQDLVARAYKKYYNIPAGYSHLFDGLDSDGYIDLLRKAIVGSADPKNVVLLEVEPTKQVTEIDFVVAKARLGIEYLCVSDVKKEGQDLYYEKDGQKIGIQRIFNRVIFDELIKRDDLPREFYFTEEANVEWAGHPNWFFRISKHTLPFLDNPYVPKSIFLNDLDQIPSDLENYVLKPLYSFAGSGVIINLNRYDLENISDPENYILQRKVKYAPVVETPNVPAKCEIRMLMIWERGAARPRIINNLARLSKGEMIGVRYNKNKDWVGGSVGFFPED